MGSERHDVRLRVGAGEPNELVPTCLTCGWSGRPGDLHPSAAEAEAEQLRALLRQIRDFVDVRSDTVSREVGILIDASHLLGGSDG